MKTTEIFKKLTNSLGRINFLKNFGKFLKTLTVNEGNEWNLEL